MFNSEIKLLMNKLIPTKIMARCLAQSTLITREIRRMSKYKQRFYNRAQTLRTGRLTKTIKKKPKRNSATNTGLS